MSAATCALLLIAAMATPVAAASPVAAAPVTPATDLFFGTAVIPAGQTSPVQVNPRDMVRREDGLLGIGYTYVANGHAAGQLPGKFHYEEHGYLYFKNPADPTTLAGSKYVSGVFTLTPANGGAPVTIADTSPSTYTSGLSTVGSAAGKFSYGYFTFTDAYGTFKGYASADFTRFVIELKFAA